MVINIEKPLCCKAKVHTVGPRCPLGPGLPCNPCEESTELIQNNMQYSNTSPYFFCFIIFLCITSRFLSLGTVLG